MNKLRSFLYKLARILGDYQAARNGRFAQRLVRQATFRAAFKGMPKMSK
jgi:hypothetical protein